MNKIDLNKISEPVADPTVTKPAAKIASLDLPRSEPEQIKHKVSPRKDWTVKATIDGIVYGPFTQNAVDESEAIQRLLDATPQLKKAANRARFRVKPVAA